MNLKRNLQIHKLASDLGIRPSSDPIQAILRYCDRRVHDFLKDAPDCTTLTELLDLVATRLDTSFEEIHSDDRLEELRLDYVRRGEKGFADLREQLGSDVFGVTFRRTSGKPWERQFVSVIDCRGGKAFRSYFTKWHELGHLLILTNQLRLSFRRTHVVADAKDPEESLVDIIAGHVGFLADFVKQKAKKEPPSFALFDRLRAELCPESSQQAAYIGFTQAWPTPCILVEARPGLRRSEQRALGQELFPFREAPTPQLRAVHITSSSSAAQFGLRIHRNMRVPKDSLLSVLHREEGGRSNAVEDLDWWESSDGSCLPSLRVHVEVRSFGEHVQALLNPA